MYRVLRILSGRAPSTRALDRKLDVIVQLVAYVVGSYSTFTKFHTRYIASVVDS